MAAKANHKTHANDLMDAMAENKTPAISCMPVRLEWTTAHHVIFFPFVRFGVVETAIFFVIFSQNVG